MASKDKAIVTADPEDEEMDFDYDADADAEAVADAEGKLHNARYTAHTSRSSMNIYRIHIFVCDIIHVCMYDHACKTRTRVLTHW